MISTEFERLLVESSTLAFRVAYGVLRQREDAEDVVQEAFIKAHRSFRRLRDRGRFRSWLVRLTWGLAIDRQRANRRRSNRDTQHGRLSPSATTADPAIESERARQLWNAIDALPERLRLPLIRTVKSRLFHAREHRGRRCSRTSGNPQWPWRV